MTGFRFTGRVFVATNVMHVVEGSHSYDSIVLCSISLQYPNPRR